jgi:hypothetical protein
VVDVGRELERIDGELDVHISLHLAAAGGIDELLGRLRHHPVAVVIEPVDQRADGRIFLIFYKRRVVKSPDQSAPTLKLFQESLVIDIEAEGLRGSVKVGAVNEKRNPLLA